MFLVASAVLPGPCGYVPAPGKITCVKGRITINGSTAVAPLIQALADDYTQQCQGATIKPSSSKSGTGLDNAEDGTDDIGTSDVFAPADKSDLVDHWIAVSIFVLFVHADLGITNLSTDQIKGIYSGQYTNWSQVGGPNMLIVPFSRTAGSGTRLTFETYVLGDKEHITEPPPLSDTDTMIKQVQNTPGAIGYAALYEVEHATPPDLIPLTIDGIHPTPDLVRNNTYKFWNIEHMYTKGHANALAQAFIDYTGSNRAKSIITSHSFIFINDMELQTQGAHCP